jgi:hypothetical protein
MDRITREVAAANGAIHVPMDQGMAEDRRLFAVDGLHPSPDGYRLWAQGLAEAVPATLAPPLVSTVVAAAAAPVPVVTVPIDTGIDTEIDTEISAGIATGVTEGRGA